jgi:RNA polymerase sigma factor (sigma-70 family)
MAVELTIANSIATVRLNDPAKRNAMSLAMFDALDEALAKLKADDAVRVVLLCGAGGVFCAGFDLRAAAADPPLMATFIHRLSRLNRALRRLPQPVVAAVDGEVLRKALTGLPPDQREVIELAYFNGLSHREIAEECNLPLGTVKSRIRIAMARLRNSLKSHRTGP